MNWLDELDAAAVNALDDLRTLRGGSVEIHAHDFEEWSEPIGAYFVAAKAERIRALIACVRAADKMYHLAGTSGIHLAVDEWRDARAELERTP